MLFPTAKTTSLKTSIPLQLATASPREHRAPASPTACVMLVVNQQLQGLRQPYLKFLLQMFASVPLCNSAGTLGPCCLLFPSQVWEHTKAFFRGVQIGGSRDASRIATRAQWKPTKRQGGTTSSSEGTPAGHLPDSAMKNIWPSLITVFNALKDVP